MKMTLVLTTAAAMCATMFGQTTMFAPTSHVDESERLALYVAASRHLERCGLRDDISAYSADEGKITQKDIDTERRKIHDLAGWIAGQPEPYRAAYDEVISTKMYNVDAAEAELAALKRGKHNIDYSKVVKRVDQLFQSMQSPCHSYTPTAKTGRAK